MRPHSYARQKLFEGLHCLVGSGSLRKRLGTAYMTLLILEADADKQLPADLVVRFRNLMGDLKKRAVGGVHGPVEINTSSPKADKMAEEILSIYTELQGGLS